MITRLVKKEGMRCEGITPPWEIFCHQDLSLVSKSYDFMERLATFLRFYHQGSCRTLISKFKESSRTKLKIFKELEIDIHMACANTQEAQNSENERFLGISQVFMYDFH